MAAAAVELDLVDRLPGAEVAQLRRAVGGQHEQRHARLVGLDHGRRVVGRRGPGGARERDGAPARLGQAEREEGAAALVQVRRRADPRLAREAQDERRGARAGRGAGLAQAAARELVAERAQAEVGVGRPHRSGIIPDDGPDAAPPPRLHPDAPELAAGDRGAGRPPAGDRAGPAGARAGGRAARLLRGLHGLRASARRRAVRARGLLDGRPGRAPRGARARLPARPARPDRGEPGDRRRGRARRPPRRRRRARRPDRGDRRRGLRPRVGVAAAVGGPARACRRRRERRPAAQHARRGSPPRCAGSAPA